MKYAVLVPGIMGSVLSTPAGDVIWPPGNGGLASVKPDDLLRPDLKVGDVIRKVSCFNFYQPLIDTLSDIGFKERGTGNRLVIFPYDWRQDLDILSRQLAATLEHLAPQAKSITIVAHSMGGLVSRLALERQEFSGAQWLDKIDALLTVATPHLGAPLAFARVLGLQGTTGLSPESCKKVSNDRRYPSAYQLLPAPGEAACWNIDEGQRLPEINIYDHASARAIGLDPQLVDRTLWVHETLKTGTKHPGIRYFYFAGTGHGTVTRLNVTDKQKIITETADAGDGTVPLWSALPFSGQKQVVIGGHTDLYSQDAFKAVFYRLFGQSFPAPPLRAGAAPTILSLSLAGPTLPASEPIELLVTFAGAMGKLETTISLEYAQGPEEGFVPVEPPFPVKYEGPHISFLKMSLPPVRRTGVYRIKAAAPSHAKVAFAATEADG